MPIFLTFKGGLSNCFRLSAFEEAATRLPASQAESSMLLWRTYLPCAMPHDVGGTDNFGCRSVC